MTDTVKAAAVSPLSGNVLFYKNPEPLTPEQHGKLGVNPTSSPYAFVAESHVVPLTVAEFIPASLSYPIVFVGNETKTPLAVMGLNQTENLFIDDQGMIRADAYIPAFVRRYPFVLANDSTENRLIVCIDRGAPFLAEGGQVALFEGTQPTDYTKQAIQFCNDFEVERNRTTNFVKLLEEHELLETREAHFTPRDAQGNPGTPQKIADYYAVSEDKLRALSPEVFASLRDNGALAQIYAHLISLLGWDRLIALAFDRAARQSQAGNA